LIYENRGLAAIVCGCGLFHMFYVFCLLSFFKDESNIVIKLVFCQTIKNSFLL
jgi:hypothetical protein